MASARASVLPSLNGQSGGVCWAVFVVIAPKRATIASVKVIVGTYRKRRHIRRCLSSLSEHVSGVSEIVFIDDSGDAENAAWLSTYGTVVEVGRRGYNAAMRAACEAADGQMCMWLEEDFEFLKPLDLSVMRQVLEHRPYLAQVALLRGPHFPIERERGGLIEALEYRGHRFDRVGGLIEHTATFTCNPSVWRGHVFAAGWPKGKWSEDRKRDQLISMGYRFAYLPEIRVKHTGERSGFDY